MNIVTGCDDFPLLNWYLERAGTWEGVWFVCRSGHLTRVAQLSPASARFKRQGPGRSAVWKCRYTKKHAGKSAGRADTVPVWCGPVYELLEAREAAETLGDETRGFPLTEVEVARLAWSPEKVKEWRAVLGLASLLESTGRLRRKG